MKTSPIIRIPMRLTNGPAWALFLFVITLSLPHPLVGQWVEPTQTRYEQKADAILQEVLEVHRAHETLFMRFQYTIVNSRGEVLEKREAQLVSQGDKYHMQVGEHYYISDGELSWVFLSDVNEVHISLVEEMGDQMTPTGMLESFANDFRATWIREQTDGNGRLDIIDLVPPESHSFYKYRAAIRSDDKQLVYIEAFDRHGGVHRYQVTEFSTGTGAENQLFSFDPGEYPGIEVVDLR